MTLPKRHHYLPRSYLRNFANQYGRICIRRRGAQPETTNIINVAAQNHLYSVELPDGSKDRSAEVTLSKYEAAAQPALAQLRSGRIPRSGSDARMSVSLLVALQMTRTPENASRFMFPVTAIERLGGIDKVTPQAMKDYLHRHHLGFEPEDPEVKGAMDLVHGLNAMGLPSKSELMTIMFDGAIQEIGPRFSVMQWSLEKCRRPVLATCDRLPAIWHEARDSESYSGSGILDAEELWFPLDTSTLLILRSAGTESVSEVEPKRFRTVNGHLARHCFEAVFHHPTSKDRAGEFRMAARRPAMRFWSGPMLDSAGQTMLNEFGQPREIIHSWVPVRDRLDLEGAA